MRVGLTGGTGHLGGRLLPLLVADPTVDEVVSVARRPLAPAAGTAGRVHHVRADLRSPEARSALAGVDVVYHLAAQLWQGPGGPRAMADATVGGADTVIGARPAAVVLASSTAVYGAWADNAVPLDEDHTPRPNPECPYAAHKLEVERRCFEAVPTVALRMAAVLGPHADPAVRRSVAGYRLAVPAVRGVAQATQFVDEDDAASALHLAGLALLDGRGVGAVLNVAPPDWLDATGIATVSGGRVVALPRAALLGGSRLAHRLRLLPFGADRSVLVCGPLAVTSLRAGEVLGWSARRSSAEVLAAALGRVAAPP